MYDVKGLFESVRYYMGRLADAWMLKGIVAAFLTIFTDVLFGNVTVFYIYLGFSAFDFVLGSLLALVCGTYHIMYVVYWIRKFVTYMVLVALFGLVSQSLFQTTGVTISLVNGLLMVCTLTEFSSILRNMAKLGLPIPRWTVVIMRSLKRSAAKRITQELNDHDILAELEKSLSDAEGHAG